MEYVVGGLALIFVLMVVLGIMVAVRTVRAVKRGVSRTGQQLRRTVEETTLKARAAQPGPVGELARIRVELRSSLDSTRAALSAGLRTDPSLYESLGLLDRLQDHARQLDGELRMLMAGEPDRARIAAQLPQARSRAERIRSSADSLRWAAQDRARSFDEDELAALDTQIEMETRALRDWKAGVDSGSTTVESGMNRPGATGGDVPLGPPDRRARPVRPEDSGGDHGDVRGPDNIGDAVVDQSTAPSSEAVTLSRPVPPPLPGRCSTGAEQTVPGLANGVTGAFGAEKEVASAEALTAEPAPAERPQPAPREGR